ncbi:hypothetical protein NXW76_06820 [Bacteroides thetaiotaomicron]|nr:hypothetical protein [Bacteroides thetaiotaomicron]
MEKIPDESCFNALIAESDLIFAAYKQFTGSSNLLTKVAAFRKPVIVSRGLCMGRRVEQYGTGQTTGEDNAGECSRGYPLAVYRNKDGHSGFRPVRPRTRSGETNHMF